MSSESARRTQRLGAYAVVLRHDAGGEQLLLTRISAIGYPPGWWALPGGGVDHGESPHVTVRRELHEETGLQASVTRLVDVHHVHTTAPGRGDAWEDYHGVHLLFAVDADTSVVPQVVEVDGTTDLARWVPLDEVQSLGSLLPVVEHVVERLDDYR